MFELSQAAQILPANLGNFNKNLPHGGRLDALQGFLKILTRDSHLLHDLLGDLVLRSQVGQIATQRLHGRLFTQSVYVRSDETMSTVCKALQVNFLANGHVAHVDLQDLHALAPIRNTYLNLPVETSRSPQSWVDGIHPVGGADDNYLASLF